MSESPSRTLVQKNACAGRVLVNLDLHVQRFSAPALHSQQEAVGAVAVGISLISACTLDRSSTQSYFGKAARFLSRQPARLFPPRGKSAPCPHPPAPCEASQRTQIDRFSNEKRRQLRPGISKSEVVPNCQHLWHRSSS